MEEYVIRQKVLALVLFAVMILFGTYVQRQNTAQKSGETAEALQEAGEVLQENVKTAGSDIPQGDAKTAGGDIAQEDAKTAGSDIPQGDAKTADRKILQEDAALPARIALTFDDGPHPVYTKALLDGLRERGVKATFFVVGENIPGHEELIRQMAQDGHLIGNHTYDHADASKMSSEKVCEELKKTSDLVEQITGNATPYVRPPFGNWNDSLDCMISMIAVKWTIDPLDWTTANTSQIVNKVVTQASDSDIILLHDYYQSSVEAAFEIVDILKERGFEFVTVEELLLE